MNSKIKFLDLKKINRPIIKNIKKKIFRSLFSGNYILTKDLEIFENKFKNFNNSKYCVAVSSGHDALVISLKALNIKKNDKVIVPSHTYISTWFAVSQIGAIPVPIDINYSNGVLDENKLPMNPINIKAVIAVNLYGNLCNLKFLKKYCDIHKIHLIEDSSQSHGAKYKNEKIKIFGKISAFSFYPGKILGSITDAGAIVTNSKILYKKCLSLRNYGSTKKYIHDTFGFNTRSNYISAIFLLEKIKKIKKEIFIRKKQTNLYKKYLINNKNLEFLENSEIIDSSNHNLVIKTKFRNELLSFLKRKKIECMIHYPVIPPLQRPYKIKYKKKINQYKISLKFSKRCISLPIGSHLSKNNIKFICSKINKYLKK